LNGSSSNLPDMYTMVGTEQLVINGMNTLPTEIPLYFNANASTTTQYHLSAIEMTNFEAGTLVYIKNNKTGVQQLISNGQDFTFDATAEPTLSIIIKIPGTTTALVEQKNTFFQAYSNKEGQIILSVPSVKNGDFVSVYNTTGQLLFNQSLSNSQTVLNKIFTQGVYVLKLNQLSCRVIIQ